MNLRAASSLQLYLDKADNLYEKVTLAAMLKQLESNWKAVNRSNVELVCYCLGSFDNDADNDSYSLLQLAQLILIRQFLHYLYMELFILVFSLSCNK